MGEPARRLRRAHSAGLRPSGRVRAAAPRDSRLRLFSEWTCLQVDLRYSARSLGSDIGQWWWVVGQVNIPRPMADEYRLGTNVHKRSTGSHHQMPKHATSLPLSLPRPPRERHSIAGSMTNCVLPFSRDGVHRRAASRYTRPGCRVPALPRHRGHCVRAVQVRGLCGRQSRRRHLRQPGPARRFAAGGRPHGQGRRSPSCGLVGMRRRCRSLQGAAAHDPRLSRQSGGSDSLPTTLWAQVVARRLRRVSAQVLSGGEALGYRPLRLAVAAYLHTSRGVKCSTDQVLIVSGVQESLERAPTSPRSRRSGMDGGPRLSRCDHCVPGGRRSGPPVPVDAEGLDLEWGQRRWTNAKLVYVTPADQFPLGVTISLRRWLALLNGPGAHAH